MCETHSLSVSDVSIPPNLCQGKRSTIGRNFSKRGGTRPPSPREVNSRGSSPAVGRFAPSGLPSLFPRLIRIMVNPFVP